jgi:hypothetical protein
VPSMTIVTLWHTNRDLRGREMAHRVVHTWCTGWSTPAGHRRAGMTGERDGQARQRTSGSEHSRTGGAVVR